MAPSRFSLLLLRNFSFKDPNFHSRILRLSRRTRDLWFFNGGNIKPFSTSLMPTETDVPKFSDPKTSLSARMSFVFDQIDAIEKERSGKDEALQRIRAWRETKNKKNDEDSSKSGFSDSVESNLSSETGMVTKRKEKLFTKEVEVVHPWPEWIELMERLVQQKYFDHQRKDEDKMAEDLSIDISNFSDEVFDFTRDWIAVRTACLNFGRDRFDILRSLSRQDIQILVGHGCPSVDIKVVFSAKRLRKHVHLDEGDVCSSCNLRNSCSKAYLLTNKEDEARTLDVMRVLLTFSFDPVNGSVENKSLLKMKSVKTVVRKLLHELVKLSAVPIDPNLPPPIIKKAPPKVKQPPPPPKKRVGRDDIEMKKGDWLCPKCDFMNFAKNTVCLQCDAKRPKRQLLPGEWECPECNFLNYRRNMACFHCEHKRPPDEFMEIQMQPRSHGPRTRLERVTKMPEISNAWNFDFDDNESDGADVAAFEFADSPRMAEDSSFEGHTQGGSLRGSEDDSFETSRMPKANGRDRYSDLDQMKSGTGFDDFDDEEDDDVDSYELDMSNKSSMQEASSKDFSEIEEYSESEDFDGFDQQSHPRQGNNTSSHNRPSRPMRGTVDISGSEDDGQYSDSYPNQKSSHFADLRNRTRGRGGSGPYRGNTFGSDDELGIDSDSDGDGPNQSKRNKWSSNRGGFGKGRSSDSEDAFPLGSESDDEFLQSGRNKIRRNKADPDRRGNTFKGRGRFESTRDVGFKSNGRINDRGNSFGNDVYDLQSGRNKIRGNKAGPDRRGNTFSGRGQFESARDARFKSNGRMSDRRNSFGGADLDRSFQGSRRNSFGDADLDRSFQGSRRNSFGDADLDRSFQGSRRNDRGYSEDRHPGGRMNDRRGNLRNLGRPRRGEGFDYRQRGRSNAFNDGPEISDDRPRRRIIER